MRKTLLFFLLLLSNEVMAQVKDDFSDGDFTNKPSWIGATDWFLVNPSKQLQSVSSKVAQTITLATANGLALNTKWTFFVQLNFDPSAANFVRIYLISNQSDLNTSLNGYYLQIGENGSADGFHLYRQNGNTSTKIINGPPKTRANANRLLAHVQVTRDAQGKWELFTDVTGGTHYTLEGSVTDNTFLTTQWFGVFCKYTATRSNGFIFDDFDVDDLVPDVTPPTLLSAKALDGNTIEATFSEPLDVTSATEPGNYSLNQPYANPASVATTTQSHVYQLYYTNALTSNAYSLSVKNVQDVKGNSIAASNTANFFYIKPYQVKKGEVLMNEIFANPSNSAGLPPAEFVELWNQTNEYILLKGWQYADVGTTYTFSTDTLMPHAYLILCPKANVNDYKTFGKTIGLSPWPILNNDKDVLTLKDASGTIIDEVAYSDTWYKDDVKKKGGYSLEMIDPKNNCKDIQNWQASNANTGGTPGTQNSVYQSQYGQTPPKLLSVNTMDGQTFTLVFSKPVNNLIAANPSYYSFDNGLTADNALPLAPLFTTVIIKFASPIERGVSTTLTVSNISDCAGNLLDPSANTAKIFIAKAIKPTDILISEVLFNPKAANPDYVEVYNHSPDILDLKDLLIANADAAGNVANIRTVTTNSVFINPQTYWVLTTNPTAVQSQYDTKYPMQFVQLQSMPAYNNASGTVILLSANTLIDRFDYYEKMHHALLNDYKGVALERVSFKVPANQAGNFKSAAQSLGFGTPTYANSQNEVANAKASVYLNSQTFSPDGDGFEDLLIINYQCKESGAVATISIYADNGRLVRKLKRNTTLATSGTETWDGLNDNGNQCKVGIYIIKFEVFYLSGKKDSFTKTCALATKF